MHAKNYSIHLLLQFSCLHSDSNFFKNTLLKKLDVILKEQIFSYEKIF